jgi:hypothetical protein
MEYHTIDRTWTDTPLRHRMLSDLTSPSFTHLLLSTKQGNNKYHLLASIGMMQLGIEPMTFCTPLFKERATARQGHLKQQLFQWFYVPTLSIRPRKLKHWSVLKLNPCKI